MRAYVCLCLHVYACVCASIHVCARVFDASMRDTTLTAKSRSLLMVRAGTTLLENDDGHESWFKLGKETRELARDPPNTLLESSIMQAHRCAR